MPYIHIRLLLLAFHVNMQTYLYNKFTNLIVKWFTQTLKYC